MIQNLKYHCHWQHGHWSHIDFCFRLSTQIEFKIITECAL